MLTYRIVYLSNKNKNKLSLYEFMHKMDIFSLLYRLSKDVGKSLLYLFNFGHHIFTSSDNFFVINS
jgi:hypothetical protein